VRTREVYGDGRLHPRGAQRYRLLATVHVSLSRRRCRRRCRYCRRVAPHRVLARARAISAAAPPTPRRRCRAAPRHAAPRTVPPLPLERTAAVLLVLSVATRSSRGVDRTPFVAPTPFAARSTRTLAPYASHAIHRAPYIRIFARVRSFSFRRAINAAEDCNARNCAHANARARMREGF